MPATIPIALLLLKERADSLRRCVEILHAGWEDPSSHYALQQALLLIQDFVWSEGTHIFAHSPAMVLEWAMEWASTNPPPPVDSLREARAILELSAQSWAESFTLLRAMLERRTHMQGRPCPDWVFEMARLAASEQWRIEATLRESWPVGAEKEELQRLAQMKSGQALSMEETFALAAGVSQEEWAEKVRAHKAKKSG